jgi:hypothetical protein
MSSLLDDELFFGVRVVVVTTSVVEVVELDVLVLVELVLVLVLVLVEELVVVVGLVVVVVGLVVVVAGLSTVKSVDASSVELWARTVAPPTTEHWVVRVAVHRGGTWNVPLNVAAPLGSAVPRFVTLAPWMSSTVMQ